MSHMIPVMLNAKGQACYIIGGGKVAERKAAGLADSGASLVLISPTLTPGLQAMAEQKQLRWIARAYAAGDIQGAFLVFAATNIPEVNEAVMREAHQMGILVNRSDDATESTFVSPSVLRRGRLTVSVSTDGAGPAVSRRIMARLAELWGPEYEEYLDFMAQVRLRIKETIPDADTRARVLRGLAELELPEPSGSVEWKATAEQVERWIAQQLEG
ncbi:Precorrin-2 dehydrogenase [compost metagenome]